MVNNSSECYVYVVQVSSGAVKVGIAGSISARMNSFTTNNPDGVQLIFSVKLLDRNQALNLEAIIHDRYKQDLIHGEWYDTDPQTILTDLRFAQRFLCTMRDIEIILPSTDAPTKVEPPQYETTVEDDPYLSLAVALVTRLNLASISLLQRRLNVGYNRAAALYELMQERGIFEQLGLVSIGKSRPLQRPKNTPPPTANQEAS